MKNSPLWLRWRSPHTEGFSLVEVLISMLMIAGFLATAMQALIAATAIKVRSEEISEATTWMQEDLEAIRFEANRLGFINGRHDPAQAPTLDVQDCSPSAPNAGFADDLKTLLEDDASEYRRNNQPKQSSIGKRTYTLQRTLTPEFNTLKIAYQVVKPGTPKPIGELYSEVIPDVSLACP